MKTLENIAIIDFGSIRSGRPRCKYTRREENKGDEEEEEGQNGK